MQQFTSGRTRLSAVRSMTERSPIPTLMRRLDTRSRVEKARMEMILGTNGISTHCASTNSETGAKSSLRQHPQPGLLPGSLFMLNWDVRRQVEGTRPTRGCRQLRAELHCSSIQLLAVNRIDRTCCLGLSKKVFV
jgi:hypothetical protein